AARDAAQNNSGWQPMGVWQVPGGAPAITTAVGAMSPSSGSGHEQTFTFTFTDTKGWQDLGVVNILIRDSLDGTQACYLAYSRQATLYLLDDSGTILFTGLGNSQCNAFSWSAKGNGNTLTLTVP